MSNPVRSCIRWKAPMVVGYSSFSRVYLFKALRANGALPRGRHWLGRALPVRNELSRLRRRDEVVLPGPSSRMREQSDPDHPRRSKRVQMKDWAICQDRAAPWLETELPLAISLA